MGARGGEADFQNIFVAAPRVQHRAPAALAMGVDDDFVHWRDQPGMAERFHHQRALPQMIFGKRPVLHGAAAAGAEMLADRRDAFVARFVDMDEMAAVRVAGDRLDRHRLARQRIGHEHRAGRRIGDAVAAMADAVES